jgi:hypothetical protein
MVQGNPLTSPEQHRSLEEAIVDTVREPLIVLDEALRVALSTRPCQFLGGLGWSAKGQNRPSAVCKQAAPHNLALL